MATNGQTQSRRGASRTQTDRPDSDLDVYHDTTKSQASVPELEAVNYGLGVYDDAEHWQQVRSYHKGIKIDSAFGRVIEDRAHRQGDRVIGEDKAAKIREDRELDYDEEVARRIGFDARSWVPVPWRMAQGRLEFSRGRDARLMDNVFGRVVERISKGGEEIKQALRDLGGGR